MVNTVCICHFVRHFGVRNFGTFTLFFKCKPYTDKNHVYHKFVFYCINTNAKPNSFNIISFFQQLLGPAEPGYALTLQTV